MKIHGKRNSISVYVDGYEFPDLSKSKPHIDEYDLNWLNVSVSCTGEAATFLRRRDPCILAFELEESLRGLEKVLNGRLFLYVSGAYLEPGLTFCALGRGNSFVFGIRYIYDISCDDWKTVSAAQRLNRNEFAAILKEITQWLETFPIRRI